MNVAQLIEQLKTCNQNAEVLTWHPRDDKEVNDVFLQLTTNDKESDTVLITCYEPV